MSLATPFGFTKSLRQSSLYFLFLLALVATATNAAAEKPILEAPTFEEVAKAIDLRKFSLPKGAKESVHRELAGVSFEVTGDGDELWKHLANQLVALGCEPSFVGKTPNNSHTVGRFKKDSYLLTGSVMKLGDRWRVAIVNHGKNEVYKIPHFESATTDEWQHFLPVEKDQSMRSILDETKAFLAADGFKHLGTSHETIGENEPGRIVATDIYMQKNATLLTLKSGFGIPPIGKGYVSVESCVISVDLPIPPAVQNIDYLVGSATSLHFETEATSQQILKFYTDEFSKRSWTKLQSDDPTEPLDPKAENDYGSETFGKSNVGRIKINCLRGLRGDNRILTVMVNFESAEDFLYSD